MERPRSNNLQESDPDADLYDEMLAQMDVGVANDSETPIDKEAVLGELQEYFGDRIFNYKSYSGTVTTLFNVCPAFPEVLAQGFDYASNWLESNNQIPEEKVDEPDKPADEAETQTDDADSRDSDTDNKKAEAPASVVEAKAEAPIKSTETSSTQQSSVQVQPAQAVAVAMPTKSKMDAKKEATGSVVAPEDKNLKESVTSNTAPVLIESVQIGGDNEPVLEVAQPKQPEVKQKQIEKNDTRDVSSDDTDNHVDVVPEHKPEIFDVSATEAVPIVEAVDVLENEPNGILTETAPEVDFADSVEFNEINEQNEAPVSEKLALDVDTELISDELPADLIDPLVDEYKSVEFEDSESDSDLIENNELQLPEPAEEGVDSAFATEFILDDDAAVVTANEIIEQYETEMVEPDMAIELETVDFEEVAEAYEESEAPVEEIIELMAELTAEVPDSAPETIPAEVIEQVSKVARSIQTLEAARSAEDCHEALSEIRVELASLLRLLGYDNADAIAERLVQQYDMATLKRYLAQLVRLLETRRSESTLTRQIVPKSSPRRFGIHAVGRVVMIAGHTPQFATL